MHKSVQKPSICKSGCVCKSGYVLNEVGGNCVKEESCPCHHGGQSYAEGSICYAERMQHLQMYEWYMEMYG